MAQRGELEPGAVDIVPAIGEQLPIDVGGRIVLPGDLQVFAEAQPAQRPAGRQFERLAHQLHRSVDIARLRIMFCIFGTAVGARVAGAMTVLEHGLCRKN